MITHNCGWETKEDWENGFDEIRQILEAREKSGANTMYQINVTKLVLNAGTPNYALPRVTSLLNWKESFEPDFYYYPYKPLLQMGVKVKASSGRGDTFVQQTLQDLPADLTEDILLKPALDYPVLSSDYLYAVKKGFEKWGIVPQAQFLEYNPDKNPRQHMRISYTDRFVKKEGMKFFEHGHQMCLKTPATHLNQNMAKCYGCGACANVDKARKECGLPVEVPHIKWMQTRDLQVNYDIADVKAAQVMNAPSFWIDAIFEVLPAGKLIAKEGLIRFWLSKCTDKDPSLIKNFRRIGWFASKHTDCDKICSVTYGYEEALLGFKDRLNSNFDEVVEYANSRCEGIKLVKWSVVQTAGTPNTLFLYKLDMDFTTEEWAECMKLLEEPYREYEEVLAQPELKPVNKWIKLLPNKSGGYSAYVLSKPVGNPFFNFLGKFTYNRLLSKYKSVKVISLLTPISGDTYHDIVRDKPVTLSGFKFCPAEGDEFDVGFSAEVEAPSADGA